MVAKLVAKVEALPADQREEVIAALLRRARTEDHDLPSDADLVAVADGLFQALDKDEQGR